MDIESTLAAGSKVANCTAAISANGKVAASLDELADMGFGGRTKLFSAVASGDLRAFKIGRSTRVLLSDAIAWLTANPVKPKAQAGQREAV